MARRKMPRRRYSTEYRKLTKRQRAAIRRAHLLDDGGERAAYLTEKYTGQTRLSWPRWAMGKRLARLQRFKVVVGMRRRMRKSRRSRKWVAKKIRILMSEGYPQRQAVAIAMRMKMSGVRRMARKRRHGRARR